MCIHPSAPWLYVFYIIVRKHYASQRRRYLYGVKTRSHVRPLRLIINCVFILQLTKKQNQCQMSFPSIFIYIVLWKLKILLTNQWNAMITKHCETQQWSSHRTWKVNTRTTVTSSNNTVWTSFVNFKKKRGIFWKGEVDSGRVAHINLLKMGYILGGGEG